jgi:hypothetical protein
LGEGFARVSHIHLSTNLDPARHGRDRPSISPVSRPMPREPRDSTVARF